MWSHLCKARRIALGTDQNPRTSADISFPQELVTFPNGSDFLIMDDRNEDQRLLILAMEDARSFLKEDETCFMDGMFSSCCQQFQQLYTVHVDLGSTEEMNNVYPVIFALFPNKSEASDTWFFHLLKNWAPERKPQFIKIGFEVATYKVLRELFPEARISGCNFHFMHCLWCKLQEIGLTKEYKENERVQEFCRQCGTLNLIPKEHVEEGWITIMSEASDLMKITSSAD
jgi:hypothetical protein